MPDAVVDESKWPAVARAYDFVIPSYQQLVNRYEAADGRLTQSITLVSTLLFGIPLFARTIRPDVSFKSPFFLVSIALLAASAIIGIAGRHRGRLRLVNPTHLYAEWLHLSEWEFKKDMVYFAGTDFTDNADAIEQKARLSALMNSLIITALMFVVVWLAS